MPRIDFELTASDGVVAYWLAIDSEGVALTNGQGSLNLSTGEHVAVWYMLGSSGDSIALTGTNAQTTVLEVKKSAIPKGRDRAAATKSFTV